MRGPLLIFEKRRKPPWIAVAVSVRSNYEELVLPASAIAAATRVTHEGFADHEYDASKTFFRHYGIELPSTPLLASEYGGHFSGSSCHFAPVPSNQKTPFSTARVSCHGRRRCPHAAAVATPAPLLSTVRLSVPSVPSRRISVIPEQTQDRTKTALRYL